MTGMNPKMLEGGFDPRSDVFNRLLKDRIVMLGAPVDDDIANQLCAQLLYLEGDDANRDIWLYINSLMSTGEPVEVTTRGGRPLIIGVKEESLYDSWLRLGLVGGESTTVERLRRIGTIDTASTADEVLRDVKGDH